MKRCCIRSDVHADAKKHVSLKEFTHSFSLQMQLIFHFWVSFVAFHQEYDIIQAKTQLRHLAFNCGSFLL